MLKLTELMFHTVLIMWKTNIKYHIGTLSPDTTVEDLQKTF